jgi:hypothetical protein
MKFRRYNFLLFFVVLVVFLASGCSHSTKKQIQNKNKKILTTPNVGHIKIIKIITDGRGKTPAKAVNDAVKLAILQANGEKVNFASARYSAIFNYSYGKHKGYLKTSAFAKGMIENSGGVITNLKVLKIYSPWYSWILFFEKKIYIAKVSVSIPKFTGPNTHGLIKIVIAPIKTNLNYFNIGGKQISAQNIADNIHKKIESALSQTGRFVVLDRSFTPEIKKELSLVTSGQTPSANYAMLGQALSANLIWVGDVNLYYNKHVQKLEISRRDLVSYSGGWEVSEQLINTATREITLSDSLSGRATPIAPTTFGVSFDSSKVLDQMENKIIRKIIASIISRTYPVTIIKMDGENVVMSQGGLSVQKNAVYKVVLLGKEMVDPQTGRKLGRIETPCAKVVIDRITPTLSYGHLIDITKNLNGVSSGRLELTKMVTSDYSEYLSPINNNQNHYIAKNINNSLKYKNNTYKPKSSPNKTKKSDNNW